MNERRTFRKRELLFLLPIIIIAVIIWCSGYFSPKGDEFVIEQNGQQILSSRLSNYTDSEEINIDGDIHLKIRISQNGIEIIETDCRDKICQNTGSISKSGESIICLPARLSISIRGTSEVDGVTY